MKTHKKSDGAPYRAFGAHLQGLRLAAGIAQQSELAKRIGCKQQSVSRWEAGISRPRLNQIPAISKALDYDHPDKLALAAGYTPKQAVASFDQPFPIDALTPDSFERFALYFLSMRYPEPVKVHRAGGQGHTQDGVDVDVVFPDARTYSFQCKRVEEFGPQKVLTAIAKHQRKAQQKVILLGRIATPQARAVIANHADWDIWDKEDISRMIRELSKDEQRRLVDTFFASRRFELLGNDASSPWQTEEEFFAAYKSQEKAFNHAWQLVGRDKELAAIDNALNDAGIILVGIEAPGGGGKTRVMREAAARFEAKHPEANIRFVSPGEVATRKSLDELGGEPKLLVVDDAQDREDIALLLQYAAGTEKTTLLFAYRSYASALIEQFAGRAGLLEGMRTVALPRMRKADAEALARQVLEARGGPIDAAQDIAELTLDCPLATVMGAHVVARNRKHYELAKSEGEFRKAVMGAFYKLAGSIGAKSDELGIQKLLRILSLLQPFSADNTSVLNAAKSVEGLEAHEVARLIKLLDEGGVLFKRGGVYRLSPDLLGDYITERSCITTEGLSSGYAENVFDAVSDEYIARVVGNLGKLDWRCKDGDPADSRLLDGIWRKLKPEHEFGDPHIKAVKSVAFYQPERALKFVAQQIEEQRFLRDLPEILKLVSYNVRYLEEACEYLWHLGRTDRRTTSPYPDHAIRILHDLCEVSPGKPSRVNEVVVDFGIRLLDDPKSWGHFYTPFDFLSGILSVEGHTTTSTSRKVTISRYSVTPAFASPMRAMVVDAIVRLLTSPDLRAAATAARELSKALSYPVGGQHRAEWSAEFVRTLEQVLRSMKAMSVDAFVLVEVVRSVSWHASRGDAAVAEVATKILDALPETLEFRATLALVDGYGMVSGKMSGDYAAARKELASRQEALGNALLSAYPQPEELWQWLEKILEKIALLSTNGQSSPYAFLTVVCEKQLNLAETIIEHALAAPSREAGRFASLALGMLRAKRHDRGIDYGERMLASGENSLRGAVGHAYNYTDIEQPANEREMAQLSSLLRDKNETVVQAAVAGIRALRKFPRQQLDLILQGNIGVSSNVADAACCLFQTDEGALHKLLRDDDVGRLLQKMREMPELKGHWIEEFLAEMSLRFGIPCAEFFMARVEVSEKKDYKYRPCNNGPWLHVPLKFRASPEFGAVLAKVLKWMVSKTKASYAVRSHAGELFTTMFAPFDAELVTVMGEWVERADEPELGVIGHALHEAPTEFVFDHRAFVVRYLERCTQFGSGCVRSARGQLFASATSGTRSGTPGEPFPEDIKLKERAEAALQHIPRLMPARRFYEDLVRYAEEAIALQLRDRESFDEDD